MRPHRAPLEGAPDDSRLRQLEIIAALPITAMWAIGALFGMKHAFVGFELFILLGGVGIVAGWMALATRDAAALPRALRLAVAAGLAVGVAVAVWWIVPRVLGNPSPSLAIPGCALVSGTRHFFRFIRARPQAMRAG
jgi:hypothetical protein